MKVFEARGFEGGRPPTGNKRQTKTSWHIRKDERENKGRRINKADETKAVNEDLWTKSVFIDQRCISFRAVPNSVRV